MDSKIFKEASQLMPHPLQQNSDGLLMASRLCVNQVLLQTWTDYKLKWDPARFGGISQLNIPSEAVWLPDIVLYNKSVNRYFPVADGLHVVFPAPREITKSQQWSACSRQICN